MTGNGKILLIGDPAVAIAGPQPLPEEVIQVCAGILDGIEAAVKNPFAAIIVVMASASAGLRNALATLRKNTDARILLLAKMYEEPEAMELVSSAGNGTGLADDYIICPVGLEKLCSAVHASGSLAAQSDTISVNHAIQTKINRLEKLATEDDLTGLKNRRYIWEFARQIIERAKKDKGRVTVLIFDIDNFKHYNDLYGHAAGDEVLKQAAWLIRRCCRKHDMVARLGGDEFAVVFWDDPKCRIPTSDNERRSAGSDHPSEVIHIARRFRSELEKTELALLGSEGRGVLTISGGLACLNTDGTTTEELFEKADQALLEAKRSGKNRVYLVGHPENDIDKIK